MKRCEFLLTSNKERFLRVKLTSVEINLVTLSGIKIVDESTVSAGFVTHPRDARDTFVMS